MISFGLLNKYKDKEKEKIQHNVTTFSNYQFKAFTFNPIIICYAIALQLVDYKVCQYVRGVTY